MIYKVDFEGQACKQIKEKAESYQYDLKSVLKGIGLLIADMWLPGDSKPQINTWEGLFEKVQEDYSYKDTIVENDFICSISNDDGISIIIEIADETIVDFKDIKSSILQVRDFLLANKWSGAIPDFLPIEQKEIRNMMNETERSIPFKCLHEAFFECAYRFPDKTALEWLSLDEKWETLSYEALKIKVLQTASMLKQEGVHTRDKVAIVLPKGENQIIAVLAILSIGATYVPIGIHQPLDRKKKIFEAGNISYALTDRDHINTLDGADTLRSFLIENSFRYVVMPETEIVKDIDSIAYIIFTSGTTGIPTLYGRTMAKWGNQSEVLLNLTVFQRQQKNTGKIIGDFTKLLPLNLVFAKEDIWKSAEMVQEQIMKDLDHLSFDGTEIMRELAKRRGVFGKALLPVVFTCVLFDCPENYFERLGSIKYAVSQTPQVFLDNQITEMGGRLHISWDVVDELFEACIIDEIFLEFVEDIKRISENNKANSTNDFVTKVWGNILTKEIITKSVVPDLLKSIDLKQIKILDYAQELCPPDVKGQVYVSESEIMNDRNKTYYKILEHPLYGRMADTGIIGVLTHDGYMEFVVPNCETSVETPDKKEDTHEEEIEKPIVKEIMKIWKEVFEIEDISIQDDFYTLGGDSIILMRLVDEMCKTLGCDVTVDDILQSENISDLANRV